MHYSLPPSLDLHVVFWQNSVEVSGHAYYTVSLNEHNSRRVIAGVIVYFVLCMYVCMIVCLCPCIDKPRRQVAPYEILVSCILGINSFIHKYFIDKVSCLQSTHLVVPYYGLWLVVCIMWQKMTSITTINPPLYIQKYRMTTLCLKCPPLSKWPHSMLQKNPLFSVWKCHHALL